MTGSLLRVECLLNWCFGSYFFVCSAVQYMVSNIMDFVMVFEFVFVKKKKRSLKYCTNNVLALKIPIFA